MLAPFAINLSLMQLVRVEDSKAVHLQRFVTLTSDEQSQDGVESYVEEATREKKRTKASRVTKPII